MEKYTKIKYTPNPVKSRIYTKNYFPSNKAMFHSNSINKISAKIPLNFESHTLNSNEQIYKSGKKVIYCNTNSNLTTPTILPSNINKNSNIVNANNNPNNEKLTASFNNQGLINTTASYDNHLNKTSQHYYNYKMKNKILNNLRNNFQSDIINKKKMFYLNVNFNVNQNYTMGNSNNNTNNNLNRNMSSKQFGQEKLNNNNYIFNNIKKNIENKELINPSTSYNFAANKKQLKLYTTNISNNTNTTTTNIINKNKLVYKRNASYTKITNYKALEIPAKKSNNDINTNSLQGIKNNNSTISKNTYEVNCKLYDLEVKMQKLFAENKTKSKTKNYNIVKKIFEECLGIMNITQTEKNFLKVLMLKYHEIVVNFNQENKLLRQSSENLQNMNLNLDKKNLELEKKYKTLLQENKRLLTTISNNKTNPKNSNSNINKYETEDSKTIKTNDETKFISVNVSENLNNENKNIIKINKNENLQNQNQIQVNKNSENEKKLFAEAMKSINEMNFIKEEEIKREKNNKKENISVNKNNERQKKIEMLNKENIDDLDSLYFYDKIDCDKSQNSNKNYQKVPKIKLHVK